MQLKHCAGEKLERKHSADGPYARQVMWSS